MPNHKQLLANRANAKMSTGPKTDAGKRKSSLNRLTHGLTAQTIVVGDEDPAKFEELREMLKQEFQPDTAMLSILVERIAADTWRLLRIPVFEAAYMEYYYKHARAKDEKDRKFNPLYSPSISEDEDEEADTPTVRRMASWLGRSEAFHNALAKLSRYETTLMNSFNRNLDLLIALKESNQKQKQLLLDSGEGSAGSTPAPHP